MIEKLFPNNEHVVDRVIRVVLGLAVVSLAFVGPQTPWAYLGLILVVTGAVGSCPIYTMLGLRTKRHDKVTAPANTLRT